MIVIYEEPACAGASNPAYYYLEGALLCFRLKGTDGEPAQLQT